MTFMITFTKVMVIFVKNVYHRISVEKVLVIYQMKVLCQTLLILRFYSHILLHLLQTEDSDLKFLESRLGTNTDSSATKNDNIPELDTNTQGSSYSSNLDNPGNSRTIAKFIRETKKPKSILLSSSNRSNRVRDVYCCHRVHLDLSLVTLDLSYITIL